MEVDGWTQFAAHRQPLEGSAPRQAQHATLRYARLLALGWLHDSAHRHSPEHGPQLSGPVVDGAQLPARENLAAYWGNGKLSSSDDQRFPVSGAVRNARALPKSFGYGRGVTFYAHTADQYAQ